MLRYWLGIAIFIAISIGGILLTNYLSHLPSKPMPQSCTQGTCRPQPKPYIPAGKQTLNQDGTFERNGCLYLSRELADEGCRCTWARTLKGRYLLNCTGCE